MDLLVDGVEVAAFEKAIEFAVLVHGRFPRGHNRRIFVRAADAMMLASRSLEMAGFRPQIVDGEDDPEISAYFVPSGLQA